MTGEHEKDTDDVAGPATPVGHDGQVPPAPHVDAQDDDEAVVDALEAADPDASADPPAEVAELAAACVRFVAARYAVMPDFTADTLSLVDQWLRDGRADIAERPETAQLVQASAGAYFGEVVRRAFGARWVTGDDYATWRLCLSTVYCAFNPIGTVREALLLETAEGWHAHLELDPGQRDAIEARLAALPAVTDEDYYAPGTRFDVIHIVFDALRELMRASGLADVRFSPDDYEGP